MVNLDSHDQNIGSSSWLLCLVLDLILVKDIGYFWHPSLSILAEELSFGREPFSFIKSTPHDVSELVRGLFTIFTDENTTIVTKLSDYPVLLLECPGLALVVAETIKRDFCGKAEISSKCPFATSTMTK